MTQNIMTTNCTSCRGDIVIAGACLEQVSPKGYAEITKDADGVYTLCLEDTHINMAVTKIAAILGMHKISSIKFVSVDRSPHCTQMHYIKHEIERTMPEHVQISDYIVIGDKVKKIGDEAIALSKSLNRIQELYEGDYLPE